MVKKNKTYGMDYINALEILYPYRVKLQIINKAYLNEEFEPTLSEDFQDPYEIITYFVKSKAYTKYNIKSLAIEINSKIKELDFTTYSFSDYIEIERKHGIDLPSKYDENWTLEEVYHYLIYIFNLEDYVVIENSILNGDILGILNCLLIRI